MQIFKSIVVTLLIIFIELCCASNQLLAQTAEAKIKLIERSEKISEYRLVNNNLRVLLVPEHTTPVVTVMVLYHVGSRNEAVGYTGSTHLLEHMMFKGTPTFNKAQGTQIAATLEGIGADYNATTWYDRTDYYETMPTDQIAVALRIEADRMRNSFIRDSDRQAEMTVVRNELEIGENDPSNIIDSQVYATAYREHPYHHPTIGWRSDVEGVPTTRLKQFYDSFYWPNNATLILVGDLVEADALALVEQYFGAIPASPAAIPPMYTVEPPQQGERRFLLHRAGELPIVEMAWHISTGRDPDIYPTILLKTILTEGTTSRLYQALIEKELAATILGNVERLYDPGLCQIVATLNIGVKPATVEAVIRAELDRLQTEPIAAAELERAKTQVISDYVYKGDGPAEIANELAEALSNGDWHIYANFTKNIASVTPEQIQQMAKKYFTLDNQTVGWFEPVGGTGAEEEPTEQSSAIENSATQPSTIKPISFKPASNNAPASQSGQKFADRIKRIKLANGTTLLMLPRTTTPTIAIVGTLLAGDAFSHHEQPYLAFITAEMLNKGTAQHNKLALARELERLGAQIEFNTDTFELSIGARCLSKDTETILTLLAEMLRQPNFPADELEKLKTREISQLREELEDPSARAYERLTQLLYPPNHPLYRRSFEERIKSVEAITVKDLEKFYQRHYGGASLILSIVGDIDPVLVEKIARAQFESWTGGNTNLPQSPTPPPSSKTHRELIAMKDKANVDIFIGEIGGLLRNSPDYHAAMLANNALGLSTLSSRLGLQVRDVEGLTYGINSQFLQAELIDGPWAINVSVNPENVDKAIDSSIKVLREYLKDGISEKELMIQKGAAIGTFLVKLSTNAGLAARLTEIEFYHLGIDYIDRYAGLIQAISKADVDTAIRRHFHPDQITIVVAGEVGKK